VVPLWWWSRWGCHGVVTAEVVVSVWCDDGSVTLEVKVEKLVVEVRVVGKDS
jgi:hypothetical protein